MARKIELSEGLQKLHDALAKKPMTARALMSRFRCPKPTMYARLARLKAALGPKLKETLVRDAARGPMSAQYSVGRVKAKAKR
jgi:hypothetical protein